MKKKKVLLAKYKDGMNQELNQFFRSSCVGDIYFLAKTYDLKLIGIEEIYMDELDYLSLFCN
ncbi:hypothetical protein ACFFIX_19505 [Metabacillus herbersteinensis]|uniref:Uncharacterized protein n=1 Tax=Metabacillus herbersteinensis TaxID=283816 RepID=A0ABV6GIQ9_9BACI